MRSLSRLASMPGCFALAGTACAQGFPAKPARIMAGASPGCEPGTVTLDAFAEMNCADFGHYGKLIRQANVKLEN